jgi:diguanylate cyclase (GGDEF)-like protein
MFNNVKHNRGLAQALFLTAFSIVVWQLAVQFDAYDVIDELVHEHEGWELDEIQLALIVSGLSGLLFCLLRFPDLSAEIKRRNKAERDVEWIARHDPLTRLPNRRGLQKVLTELEISNPEGQQIAAFSIDLNGFKKLGHQAGDEALIEVAGRLKAIFPTDQVFRLGADEFLVLQVQGKTTDIYIALDDFWTGYSSLSHLSKFQFDKIKIDQSFVRAFETEAKQDKIVRAIIGIGQGLGLATTAEGIETADQAEILTAMGCDVGQGYYFGKAMSEADVLKFLRKSSDMSHANRGYSTP